MTGKRLLLQMMIGSALVVLVLVACATPMAAPTTTPVSPTNTPESAATASALAYTVQVTKDIEYTRPLQPDVRAQELDVYAPEQPGPWPRHPRGL